VNATLLNLYHRLPPITRTVAATWYGHKVRNWRYGPESERLVEEALARETWPAERWKGWQQERLAELLELAATRVPYYQRLWQGRTGWDRLENWPLLEKEPLRAEALSFLTDGADPRPMARLHTSGTTGKPLDLWAPRAIEREWWALFEARWRRWYGVDYHDRWAVIGGKPVTHVSQRRPPYWVWDAAQRLLYLSTYHLAPDTIGSYLDELRDRRVRYLRGYSSSLYTLAQGVLRQKRTDLRMEVVITYAEVLHEWQRDAISQAFQCPVRETYGMVEMAAAASECEHGRMHLWPEAGWTELLEDGELVSTGLLNTAMPLIRYRIGDSAAPPTESECPCGRTLPLMGKVEGRLDDVVYTTDGRRFGCLDVVHAGMAVREAQVIQEDLDRFRVKYVPAPEFTRGTAAAIVEELQSQLGPVRVALEEVERVPRGANGKFRMIVCQLPSEVRKRLDAGEQL
jgi:phenylacetate-CoA ligase